MSRLSKEREAEIRARGSYLERMSREDLDAALSWEEEARADLLNELRAVGAEYDALMAKLNTPELHDFAKAVVLEAAYQRKQWGSESDAGKQPSDWFWLIGYLAGKALAAHIAGNAEKVLHHTISTAAALANWHSAVMGKTCMRPGHAPAGIEASKEQP